MDGTPTQQTVDYDAFKVAFSESTGKMQSRFDEPSITSLHISEHACVQKDVERATIYLELSKLISTHGCFELGAIEFYFNPVEVKVKQAGIKKGDLKLVPGTDLSKIQTKSLVSNYKVGGGKVYDKYVLEAPQKVKGVETDKFKKECIFAAFWWVIKTPDVQAANMELASIKGGPFTFPIYQNTRALKVGEVLAVFDPPQPSLKRARR